MSLLSKQPKTYFPEEEVQVFLFRNYVLVPNCPGAKLSVCTLGCQMAPVPNCPGVKLSTVPNCLQLTELLSENRNGKKRTWSKGFCEKKWSIGVKNWSIDFVCQKPGP